MKNPFCVVVLNFVKIVQTVAEISRFCDFQDGGSGHLAFSKITSLDASLFPAENSALFVQKKLSFNVKVRISCGSGVLASSFRDVTHKHQAGKIKRQTPVQRILFQDKLANTVAVSRKVNTHTPV